ncbi:MAG: histidinol-phosphatase HisJ family protein [Ruminococcus sp.]|nr:histidinol-phosphatase HisJ family protein [Ruminococcus sp.]
MLFDSHTHSYFSPDADKGAEIEAMAIKAQELGLSYITVTDHCDCCYWLPESEGEYDEYQKADSIMFGSRDYSKASIEKTLLLKQKHENLLCGTELGEPLQNIKAAEEILSIDGLDFVIGSLHMNSGKPDFYYLEYDNVDISVIRVLLGRYFTEVLDMCKWGGFDSLGHLTYPLRYIQGEYEITIDMRRYNDIIREIFCTLIEKGKALELNTSGFRQKYGKPFPEEKYLRLYRELGGELVTIGSDAHNIFDIGAGIRRGEELLKACGFKYITVYKGRKPENFKLDI